MSSTSLWQELSARGLIAQHTGQAEIEGLWHKGAMVFYLGVDPTGDSLHVGHLTPLMLMKHLSNAGHKPIVIVGGGTAMVGDPTGKSESRPILSRESIAHNTKRIAAQIQRVLGEQSKLEVIDNAEWLMELGYIGFLRDVGRHFSINRMLSAESVKQRLSTHLSFLEFNYPLLQAFDFLTLHRRLDCTMQIGGDDQWGNLLAGVDLTRRADSKRVEAMTVPLLTTANGAKMGKTAQGAVWLAAEKLSPWEFYQFWVQTEDADILRFLKIYTFLPLEELGPLEAIENKKADVALIKQAKHLLAFEVTSLLHGPHEANQALAAAQAAFGAAPIAHDLVPSSKIPRTIVESAEAVPTLSLSAQELEAGILLIDVLVRVGWVKSKNEARRLLTQGSVRLEDEVVVDLQRTLVAADLASSKTLRAGKRRVYRLKCTD